MVPGLRGSAQEKLAMCMNGHDDSEPRHQGHHGGTAVAHERKRKPYHRQDTRHHADVHEYIYEEREHQRPGEQLPERTLRLRGDVQPTVDDEQADIESREGYSLTCPG